MEMRQYDSDSKCFIRGLLGVSKQTPELRLLFYTGGTRDNIIIKDDGVRFIILTENNRIRFLRLKFFMMKWHKEMEHVCMTSSESFFYHIRPNNWKCEAPSTLTLSSRRYLA